MPKQELVNGPVSKDHLTWDDIKNATPGTLFQVVDDSKAVADLLGDVVMITRYGKGIAIIGNNYGFWEIGGILGDKLRFRKLDPSEKVVLSNE